MPQYSKLGPPFDFLGHLSESQKGEFYTWLNKRSPLLGDMSTWWSIRAQQLRKTAGAQEQFFKEKYDTPQTPRWSKTPWQPGPNGHFPFEFKDDLLPAQTVSQIKDLFKEQLLRDDEAQFQMNHVRTLVEKAEDRAAWSNDGKEKLKVLMGTLDRCFGMSSYSSVLVKDKSDLYDGSPRYRVSPMDEPTKWEREINSGSTTIVDKEQ